MTGALPPALEARGLVKRYGEVIALDGAHFELCAGEILAVIGDNGAGKSTLIKALSGAMIPDAGELRVGGMVQRFANPLDAQRAGIETVYQTLAVAPAMSVEENIFLGREVRRGGPLGTLFRMLDKPRMRRESAVHMAALGIAIASPHQAVETLSGGQRQAVAVVRGAAFARHVVIMDEPTAALGVKESAMVLDLIRRVKERGLAVVLVSHNLPQVFEVADRIHVQRLGKRVALAEVRSMRMSDAVALMTGASRADDT